MDVKGIILDFRCGQVSTSANLFKEFQKKIRYFLRGGKTKHKVALSTIKAFSLQKALGTKAFRALKRFKK